MLDGYMGLDDNLVRVNAKHRWKKWVFNEYFEMRIY